MLPVVPMSLLVECIFSYICRKSLNRNTVDLGGCLCLPIFPCTSLWNQIKNVPTLSCRSSEKNFHAIMTTVFCSLSAAMSAMMLM